MKPLGNTRFAVMLISNATNTTPPIDISVPLAAVSAKLQAASTNGHLYVRDLYQRQLVPTHQVYRSDTLPATHAPTPWRAPNLYPQPTHPALAPIIHAYTHAAPHAFEIRCAA